MKNVLIVILTFSSAFGWFFVHKLNSENHALHYEIKQLKRKSQNKLLVVPRNLPRAPQIDPSAQNKLSEKTPTIPESYTYSVFLKDGGAMTGNDVRIENGSIIIDPGSGLTVTLKKSDIVKVERISNKTLKKEKINLK